MTGRKLPQKFFRESALTVAPLLLGKILVHRTPAGTLAGTIVETEAYGGPQDSASHAFGGKKTRNAPMFAPGGIFYVYFTYGNHFCCNIVTGNSGQGEAVLIRALEPLRGIEQMSRNRYGQDYSTEKERIGISNGPGKLCKAMGINKLQNGLSVRGEDCFLLSNAEVPTQNIGVSPRIGISRSVDFPWRFFIKQNPFVTPR